MNKVKSTWSALVSLDVNCVQHCIMEADHSSLEILQYLTASIHSYFTVRLIVIIKKELDILQGVPQGSILVPTLLNLLFNLILNNTIPIGGFNHTYADDLGLIVKAKDKQNLIKNRNKALGTIFF